MMQTRIVRFGSGVSQDCSHILSYFIYSIYTACYEAQAQCPGLCTKKVSCGLWGLEKTLT